MTQGRPARLWSLSLKAVGKLTGQLCPHESPAGEATGAGTACVGFWRWRLRSGRDVAEETSCFTGYVTGLRLDFLHGRRCLSAV